MNPESKDVLKIVNLKTYFQTEQGAVKSVDGVDLFIKQGETLGLVGESGCGKSMTSLSIIGLVPRPGKVVDGTIEFKGKNLAGLSDKKMRSIRGNRISMIFQEPMTSLNPVYTVGNQVAEVLKTHQKLNKKEAWDKAIAMLKKVGIPSPEKRVKQYPYELSGGMRQRVMIAIALACEPELLIADEPTTALDVTIQAQILDLLKELQEQSGTSVLMITHDLGVVAETCQRVAVMYAGQVVEHTDVVTLFDHPKHPYTMGLLESLPKVDRDQDLKPIKGSVPAPLDLPEGCRFAPRCPFAKEICHHQAPDLTATDDQTDVRCWMYTDDWHSYKEPAIEETEV